MEWNMEWNMLNIPLKDNYVTTWGYPIPNCNTPIAYTDLSHNLREWGLCLAENKLDHWS